jgi:hypothetical protein
MALSQAIGLKKCVKDIWYLSGWCWWGWPAAARARRGMRGRQDRPAQKAIRVRRARRARLGRLVRRDPRASTARPVQACAWCGWTVSSAAARRRVAATKFSSVPIAGRREIPRPLSANARHRAASRPMRPMRRWLPFASPRPHDRRPARSIASRQRATSATPAATNKAAIPFCANSRNDNVSRARRGKKMLSATPNAKTNNVVVEPIACTRLNGASIRA